MPYIASEHRPQFNYHIEELIKILKTTEKKDGAVNYCISRLVAGAFKPDTGWNYEFASDGIKAFESAKLEYYRRVLSQYEDTCINKNGDIPEYE